MMEQVKVPIIGVIENMSGFTCPSCGDVTHIFHQGGGEAIAAELGVP
jgi:ATP-binding protein involved in chromosome partitioning